VWGVGGRGDGLSPGVQGSVVTVGEAREPAHAVGIDGEWDESGIANGAGGGPFGTSRHSLVTSADWLRQRTHAGPTDPLIDDRPRVAGDRRVERNLPSTNKPLLRGRFVSGP
jgi:hypothetical protein